jgi:two-component system alkaline phosphatase synthesis response regulator PhoP
VKTKHEGTILLVDDEYDILEFLGYNLEKEGYKIFKARSGNKAIKLAREFRPDLIILDVMMPGMDGIETCKEMRKCPELRQTIITFLTARGDDHAQITGLEAGGDYYIFKPIKPKLLTSRIQAMLRRYPPTFETARNYSINGITIDKDRFLVIKDKKEIQLLRKEFELLGYLLSRADKVVTREEIFANVWGHQVIVSERTIDVHVHRLREKLGIDLIRTIKGVGYKLEPGE